MDIPCAEVCTRVCGKTPNTMFQQCSYNDQVYDVMAEYSNNRSETYLPGTLKFEGNVEFGGTSFGTKRCADVGGIDSCTPTPAPGPSSCDMPTWVSGCTGTSYGCCPDKKTASSMPTEYQLGNNHQDGCQKRNACAQTRFGCCRDGIETAHGPGFEGCSVGGCEGTEFGCCPGQKIAAKTPDKSDCCAQTSGCAITEFGCCADGITPAASLGGANCDATTTGGCNGTQYGCCPDMITAATGTRLDGSKICNLQSALDTELQAELLELETGLDTNTAMYHTRRQMQNSNSTNRFLTIF